MVGIELPGKGNSNFHDAKPVYQIISMIKWIRTSRLSIQNSLYAPAPKPDLFIPLSSEYGREREFFIDNLLVRMHFIIEMKLVDRACAIGI